MSSPAVSVIIPAYNAQKTIARAVESLTRQTLTNWEALIISDDGTDYASLLHKDARIRHLTTGATATGASHARNVGLTQAQSPIIAMLDADDRFYPEKLKRTVPLAREHSLCVGPLRYVEYTEYAPRDIALSGTAAKSGSLTPAQYLRLHYTSHAMLVFDKTRIHAQWPEDMPVLNDLMFTFKAFNDATHAYHINDILHEYIYTHNSLSTGKAAPPRYIAAKHDILARLDAGTLGLTNPNAIAALREFLQISLNVEAQYASALERGEHITFSELMKLSWPA